MIVVIFMFSKIKGILFIPGEQNPQPDGTQDFPTQQNVTIVSEKIQNPNETLDLNDSTIFLKRTPAVIKENLEELFNKKSEIDESLHQTDIFDNFQYFLSVFCYQ